jgi:pimeloyl-ACP methyl ester carboxylesterase
MSTILELTSADGTPLSAAYWPTSESASGVVIVHGLDSRKENHSDFAETCRAAGLAVLAVDLRGHGASGGVLDAGAVDDVLAGVAALRARGHERIGIRGSSLGGFLALAAAPRSPAVGCVAAICPAQPAALAERLGDPWPRAHQLEEAVRAGSGIARGFWHATGDERVPWAGTVALAELAPHPRRVRVVLGGDHGSLQHDPRIQAETCDFLRAHLA